MPTGRRIVVAGGLILMCVTLAWAASAAMSAYGPQAVAIAAARLLAPPEGDMTLRTGVPCAPPCWHGITPGTSTARDVEGVLNAQTFVTRGTLRIQAKDNIVYFSWLFTSPAEVGYVRVIDGRVAEIQAVPGFDLTLGEMVDRFGPPARVWPQAYIGEISGYGVKVYYPDKGLVLDSARLDYSLGSGGTYAIERAFPIKSVYYVEPKGMREILLFQTFGDTAWADRYLAQTRPWLGFGRFPY